MTSMLFRKNPSSKPIKFTEWHVLKKKPEAHPESRFRAKHKRKREF